MLIGSLASAVFVHIAAWAIWSSRGKYVLLVYSDSTIWKEYFESEVIPRLHEKAVVLNWSHRKRWKTSLATIAFRRYGGRSDFNPMAFVFIPYKPVKTFRYYSAFKEYKQGHPGNVGILTDQLIGTLESIGARPAA